MKRKRRIMGLVLLAVLFAAVFHVIKNGSIPKRYVELCYRRLDGFTSEMLAQCRDGEQRQYGLWTVTYWESQNMLEFSTCPWRLGQEQVRRGFYYSPHDLPLGVQGQQFSFLREGEGWIWQEGQGDSWEYTEKLTDRWYWYEAEIKFT